ncbi:Zinc knuckle [Popillia japonica]|uniref:Zinc knuckle n=1 Tax=Popillia japonica TaxID=7064 RepID=A0AAW1N3F8_POPJA
MKGDVMVEVQGGKDKAEALKQEIIKNSADTQVEIKNSKSTVYVTGIDGDINSDEVSQAIKNSGGGIKTVKAIKNSGGGKAQWGDIDVVSLRPTQYGSQNATVRLNKAWAMELCKKGTVRIGWTPCRVRQRANIIRCYRCLEFGHYKWECEGENKADLCLKCGARDHRAKDCTGESFCLTCKRAGHRADQTRCPHSYLQKSRTPG